MDPHTKQNHKPLTGWRGYVEFTPYRRIAPPAWYIGGMPVRCDAAVDINSRLIPQQAAAHIFEGTTEGHCAMEGSAAEAAQWRLVVIRGANSSTVWWPAVPRGNRRGFTRRGILDASDVDRW
jgi:hypothetical protein